MFPNTSETPVVHFKVWLTAVLKSMAQIAFSNRAGAGVVITAAIACVGPWNALGALVGAVLGTTAGRFHWQRDGLLWSEGLYGVNPAILGILWGGVLSQLDGKSLLFLFAVPVCVALEHPVRNLLGRWDLPVLAVPALLSGWGSSIVFAAFGESFWLNFSSLPFGDFGAACAIVLVAAVAWWRDPGSAVPTLGVTALVGAASGWVTGGGWVGPSALWAFSVAPVVYYVCLVVPSAQRRLWLLFLCGATVAGILWFLWSLLVPLSLAPPLMMPLIAGIWAALIAVRAYAGPMATDVDLSRAVRLLMAAHGKGGRVVALTGAGISTPSGIPDYTAGTLIEPGYQAIDLSYGRFLISQRIRSAYWATCARFRDLVEKAEPNAAHASLGVLAIAGWINGIVTQNVDGLHGTTEVVELHGNIFSVRCTTCDNLRAWPGDGAWINHDVTCPGCGGFLKPAVIAMGENIDPLVWSKAMKLIDGCALLLAVATRLAVSSGANLLAEARRGDAPTIFITQGGITGTVLDGDVVVQGDAVEILQTLQKLLAIRTL